MFVRWADAPRAMTGFYRLLISTLLLTPFFFKQQKNLPIDGKYLYFPLLEVCSRPSTLHSGIHPEIYNLQQCHPSSNTRLCGLHWLRSLIFREKLKRVLGWLLLALQVRLLS